MSNTTQQTPTPDRPALLKRTEVATLLGVSRRTIDNLCAQGLPHVMLGARCARFNPAEVLAWCERERGIRRLGKARRLGGEAGGAA